MLATLETPGGAVVRPRHEAPPVRSTHRGMPAAKRQVRRSRAAVAAAPGAASPAPRPRRRVLRFPLPDAEDQLVLLGRCAPDCRHPSVEDCAILRDWNGTRPTFVLRAVDLSTTVAAPLSFIPERRAPRSSRSSKRTSCRARSGSARAARRTTPCRSYWSDGGADGRWWRPTSRTASGPSIVSGWSKRLRSGSGIVLSCGCCAGPAPRTPR